MARRGLGSPGSTHIAAATRSVDEAWRDLERMPPTCRGGIEMASRALANAEKAQAHLASVEDSADRERHTVLFGQANLAAKAAHETVQFFAGVCEAPGREASDRPLFSRTKALKQLKARSRRGRR